jgi:hypothetical protein
MLPFKAEMLSHEPTGYEEPEGSGRKSQTNESTSCVDSKSI